MGLKEALKSIYNTLGTIPVSGKENLARMLGCMQLIETIVEKLGKAAEKNDGDGERENVGSGLDVADGRNGRADDGIQRQQADG